MTATPAKKTPTQKLRLEYVVRELPADQQLEIHDFPGRPEVQVLGVDRIQGPMQQAEEGHFEPTWINVWKLVLVWR